MVKKKKVTEENSEHSSHENHSPKKNPFKKLKGNFWAISTIVLAVLLIIVLAYSNFNKEKIISSEEVGQKIVDFAKANGAEATLINVSKKDGLYEVVVSLQGQEVPVYVTLDGKNLVPNLIPLDTEETTTDTPTTPTPTNIPKSEKPVVEAFVMSHCPYGTQIEKGLIPVANLLKDKIDFEIKFVYYAMHPSQGEVQEELNQYCIQSEQNEKYISYLTCFLDKGDGASCIKTAKVDETKLKTCTEKTDKEFAITENLNDKTKWLNGNFPLFNIYKADNEKYSVGGSPTLIINGVEASAGRDSASLLKAVCAAFETAPTECETELSSASPSPGFGFSTTDSATAATCG